MQKQTNLKKIIRKTRSGRLHSSLGYIETTKVWQMNGRNDKPIPIVSLQICWQGTHHIDELVKERHNSIANAWSYVFLH